MSGCGTAPDLVVLIGPRHVIGVYPDQVGLEAGNHATRLPSCRTAPELRPLATARPRRFEWSAWGTQQFLGRGAQRPQSPSRGKRPSGFDPEELFGAAWWLTPWRDTAAAQATGAIPLVPRVTIQEACQSFSGEFFSLDFRGHRVVRPGSPQPLSPQPTDRASEPVPPVADGRTGPS